jgi:hypothetical protein
LIRRIVDCTITHDRRVELVALPRVAATHRIVIAPGGIAL